MNQFVSILISFVILIFSSGMASGQQTNQKDLNAFRETYERNLDSLIHSHFFEKSVISSSSKKQVQKDSLFAKKLSEIPDSVFIKRLNKIPTTIPLQYNSKVRNLIEFYIKLTQRRSDLFFALSNYYNPIFEEIMDAYGLPLEFKYLPVVESALNPNAVSRVGATGLWQFMYATGKMYGLKVNSLVDERKDPIKSSIAAANYLLDLHHIFNDWTLALAAYNCGPGNVNKAIRRSGGNTRDFWAIYEFLPAETRGYVPAFIAVNYVLNYHHEHGIYPTLSVSPIITDTVMVADNIHFKQISSVIPDLSIEQLRDLNPQYKGDIIPGRTEPYSLKLPIAKVSTFITHYDSIINFNADSYFKPTDIRSQKAYDIAYHKVRKGDSWSKIASNYGVSVSNLKKWNGVNTKYPQVGKRLKIYKENALYAASKPSTKDAEVSKNGTKVQTNQSVKPKAQTASSTPKLHKVRKGETISGIAVKYRISSNELMRLNGLKSSKIRIDQVLKVSK